MSDAFLHPPLEEYLEAIHELEEEGTAVIQARLAERLGHAAPSVSEMVRRLRAEGYLAPNGRTISLTAKGRRRAESVVRKHRLAERLLTDIIGLEWHKAHIEACRWEHVISDEVEARLVLLLGNPATCPHGNPIPGVDAPKIKTVQLSSTSEGDTIRLERITEQVELDFAALTYLNDHKFIPGAEARVRSVGPDGVRTLELTAGSIALGRELSEQLYVSSV